VHGGQAGGTDDEGRSVASARQGQGFDRPRARHPRWHDQSCHEALQAVRRTSELLAKHPLDPWLRGRIRVESKVYKKVSKIKQKQFVSGLFDQLEAMNKTDPRGYMDLVRSLKQGRFDKPAPSDTAAVPPDVWFDHFRSLLGKVHAPHQSDIDKDNFIKDNIDQLSTELDSRFTYDDIRKAIKLLKNNKATGFDMICNEMLKHAGPAMEAALLLLFNTMLTHNLYPQQFKQDICQPLFKCGLKSDPGNFRGITVSSCLGKLFNSMLRCRLEARCVALGLIRPEQASGQRGARTADHLLVFHHIIQKYVKNNNNKLYICFIDLRKCYDTVNRTRLFFELISEYKIGGKFLNILQNIYTNNQVYIKLDEGLTQPFTTTTGCKQGDNLSPLLYNILTNRLPTVFDSKCDPVCIENRSLQCLSWADDCVLISQSQSGLQRAIDKAVGFFNELGLSVNTKKTQCMVMNKRGLKSKAFPNIKFTANGQPLVLADQYTYLGLVFVPSGASSVALEELQSRASRAYFSISNVLFCNKKMSIQQALRLVDSLVFPVSFYAAEFLTPLVLPAKSFSSPENLLRAWENYSPEKLNQRACRLLLSVHRKASRLAVLGDLGRYPVLLTSLASSLKYEQVLRLKPTTTLAGMAFREMESMVRDGTACWLDRIGSIRRLLGMPDPGRAKPDAIGSRAKVILQSKFDLFYLEEINRVKLGADGTDHNKLRFYASLKGCFKPEPYTQLVSRNQRSEISRVRLSAHRLRVETARYKKYTSPADYRASRCCIYCQPAGAEGTVDDEYHLFECPVFVNQQRTLFRKAASIINHFQGISMQDKIKILLCPTKPEVVRLVNRYIKIVMGGRDKLDEGCEIESLNLPEVIINMSDCETM
jgi:hypothetical protein